MTEPTPEPTVAPGKLAKWKRALVGGLLSALVAGVFAWLCQNSDYRFSIINILGFSFFLPIFILFGNNFFEPYFQYLIFTLTIVFWFVVGAFITSHAKKTDLAIRNWILLLIPIFVLACIFLGALQN